MKMVLTFLMCNHLTEVHFSTAKKAIQINYWAVLSRELSYSIFVKFAGGHLGLDVSNIKTCRSYFRISNIS